MGIIVSLGISIGFALVGLAPPEFKVARICFWGSALMLGGMELVWATGTEHSILWRIIVGGLIGAAIFILLPEGLRLIHKRESLVAISPSGSSPHRAPNSTPAPSLPQPSPEKPSEKPGPLPPKKIARKSEPHDNQEVAKSPFSVSVEWAMFNMRGKGYGTSFWAAYGSKGDCSLSRFRRYFLFA